MVPINRKVLDISHHNTVQSWRQIRAAGIIGVIHKATEGTGYTDPNYLKRCAPAMRAGLLWGAYHFANGSNVQAQIDHFLGVVGVDDETLYALDWEDDPKGHIMTRGQARQFLELIDARIGKNRCVVYSGNTAKQALGKRKDAFFGAHRLWLAQYSSRPVCQASWDTFWLHQYSDGVTGPEPHGCPGVSGKVDTNSFIGSDDELRAQWTGVIVHRARQRMVNHRTAVVSQIRGLLLDRGFAFAKSITRARRVIPDILADQNNELTGMAREAIAELYDLFRDLDRRIASFDKKMLLGQCLAGGVLVFAN